MSQRRAAPPDFTAAEIDVLYRIMAARRDMRHFLPDPLPAELLARLLSAAHLAPSVGLMQPWWFLHIRDRELRGRIHALVEAERETTARALGQREDEFMKLKVEGILDCGEVLVAALPDGRERHLFGRRSLPEMDLASLSCALQNLWLAARVEGVGMGWVSLFEPEALRALLDLPQGSRPVAVICLGRVEAFYPRPMLQVCGWTTPRSLDELVFVDRWRERS
jgi:5,6-dimethylbenzimidazole synthase